MSRHPKRARVPSPTPATRKRALHHALWLVAVLVVTAAVYSPSLDNGFTNWDDNFYVTENAQVVHHDYRALLAMPVGGNVHPLTMWSLVLNHQISGLDPSSYHALNLLLHLANTALVFAFVWILGERRLWTTVFTSLLFGIHPMHVESVAWIAERKDVLYASFYLLGLIAYLRYLDRKRLIWWGASLAAFVLSAASKPAAVVFPIALLLIDGFRGRAWSWRMLVEKVPHFAVSVATGLVTIHAQRVGGAITQEWSALERLFFACYGIVQYVAKAFVPVGLSAIYPYPSLADRAGGPYFAAFVAVVILLPLFLWLFRRSRVVLFGAAFFFVHLVLVLQIFAIGGAVMADRYTYLPYVGLFFACAWWLDERPGPRPFGLPVKPVMAVVLVALVPFSLVQTWKRCDVWQNSGTLWDDTIAKYPARIPDAYINRGVYLQDHGERERALADFDQALALNPNTARAWNNRADLLAAMSRDDSALVSYDRVIALDPRRATAWNNRGALKYRNRDLAGAIADYTQAIALDSTYRDAYSNRALAHLALKQYEASIADGRRAIELDPGHPRAFLQHGDLGIALQELGRTREAIAEYDVAIGAAPDDPRVGTYYLRRSLAWNGLGDHERALADARAARRLGVKGIDAYLRALGE